MNYLIKHGETGQGVFDSQGLKPEPEPYIVLVTGKLGFKKAIKLDI